MKGKKAQDTGVLPSQNNKRDTQVKKQGDGRIDPSARENRQNDFLKEMKVVPVSQINTEVSVRLTEDLL